MLRMLRRRLGYKLEGFQVPGHGVRIALADLIEPIHGQPRKSLPRTCDRPLNFDGFHRPGLAQADLRPQGGTAEAPARAHRFVDASLAIRSRDRHLDARADRGAIRADALELEGDPMVRGAGILEERIAITVAFIRA